jgi:hypothetical protein
MPVITPPRRLTEALKPRSSPSPPNSLLPLLLPSLPEFEEAFVLLCTNSKLLVELSLFAYSWKLNLFILVELLLFSLRLLLALGAKEVSFKAGIVVVEMDRNGRAIELGRLALFAWPVAVLVPPRVRKSPESGAGDEYPCSADIA